MPPMTMKTTIHFPDVQSFIEFLLRPDRAFRQRYMFRSVGDLDLEGVTLLSGGVPSKQTIRVTMGFEARFVKARS